MRSSHTSGPTRIRASEKTINDKASAAGSVGRIGAHEVAAFKALSP